VLVVALAIFALQNTGTVPLQFLGYGATGNVWWIVLGAAVLGFVVAVLLMLPGRVAASWRIQGLSRQMQRQDQEIDAAHQQQMDMDAERTQFQQQYQQMQAQRDQLANNRQSLVAERNQLAAERDRLLSERNQPSQQPIERPVVAQQPAAAMIPGTSAAPFVETPPAPTPERSDVPREDVVMDQRPDPERIRETTEHDGTTQDEQPSLANRVRDFFHGPSEPSTPDTPPDETAQPDNAFTREDRPVGPPA
jgi:uncharacterized integral membrane protein